MKKSKFFFAAILIIAAIGSCSKNDSGNITQLFTPTGNSTFITANQGGNVTCEEVALATNCTFEESSGRINYSGGEGGTVGPITWTTDGTYVNWSSSVPVNIAIIVKGGPNASVYSSNCGGDCVTSGTGLSAPINPKNGKPYGLSNITFCYTPCYVVAFKGFTTDGKHCVSSGNLLFSDFSTKWCGPLGYNYYTPTTFNIVTSPPSGFEIIGTATVLVNGSIEITLRSGDILDKIFVYVGTLEDLQNDHGTYGCPEYGSWEYFDTNGSSVTITPTL